MRCLLNALQLWHECCQHVHMFQAWPNISHAHKQLYLKVIHKRARLGCLALGSLPNPWGLQQENLISSLVGCALVPAGAWRSKGNWSDLRGGGVSLGMFPLGRCGVGPVLGHTLAELFLQEFAITVLSTAHGKAPVAPISTGTCSAGHICPWQEQGTALCCLWSMGGRGTRQFLPYTYPHEPELWADTSLQAQKWIKLNKWPGPAGCKRSYKATDPFQVGMGLMWCETPSHTYAMLATSPGEASALQQLRHHWLQQHQCPTALLAELSCENPSGASLSSSPLQVHLWEEKNPQKSYLHKYHNFYCSVHSFWRHIPKLHSYSLLRICAFFQFEFAWLWLPVGDSCVAF